MSKMLAVTVALAVLVGSTAELRAEGDAAAGAKTFRKCKACHVVDSDKNRVGPSLQGVFGRAAGTVEGFKYSDAMTGSGITWDDETIAAYLADPKGYIPKNRMAFQGLKKESDIANVIAYLKEAGAQ